jgi:hypothetical protein
LPAARWGLGAPHVEKIPAVTTVGSVRMNNL